MPPTFPFYLVRKIRNSSSEKPYFQSVFTLRYPSHTCDYLTLTDEISLTCLIPTVSASHPLLTFSHINIDADLVLDLHGTQFPLKNLQKYFLTPFLGCGPLTLLLHLLTNSLLYSPHSFL